MRRDILAVITRGVSDGSEIDRCFVNTADVDLGYSMTIKNLVDDGWHVMGIPKKKKLHGDGEWTPLKYTEYTWWFYKDTDNA